MRFDRRATRIFVAATYANAAAALFRANNSVIARRIDEIIQRGLNHKVSS